MTKSLNPDCKTMETPLLPFAAGELDRSGLRLTRAEFARFLGVSKTAITDMVKSGKVTIDPDGRLDPRRAVSQLLRNSNPERLRSKVLAPLLKDLGSYQKRIADLEVALAAAKEDADFHEEVALEFADQLEQLRQRLNDERSDILDLSAEELFCGVLGWLNAVISDGADWRELSIMSCIPEFAPVSADDIPENSELAALMCHSSGARELTTEGETRQN